MLQYRIMWSSISNIFDIEHLRYRHTISKAQNVDIEGEFDIEVFDIECYRDAIWILARYDIVRLRTMSYVPRTTSYVRRTMSYSTSYVRYRTYDVTYDIEHTTSYVCQHRRCDIRHRRSDVRYRRFHEMHVVYDRMFPKTYDIVGLSIHVV
jgi:hypothetical protein